MLSLDRVGRQFGALRAVRDVSLTVTAGEIVGVIGPNGAGKSTLFNLVAGAIKPSSGAIRFLDHTITNAKPYQVARLGLGRTFQIPKPFKQLTVRENVMLSALRRHHTPRQERTATLETVFGLLPILAERRTQIAGSLSGGEQQMCAIGRALMTRPRLLMLDEPTEGLAPLYVERLFELIAKLRDGGITILLVEQNVEHVLKIADRGYVLENGRIVLEDTGQRLLQDARLKTAYLGL
jgi:branched-chain amino acid transport system ATP-binding protein